MPAPISPVHGAVGAELRHLRLARGLTQQEVANRVGVHRTYVNQVEAGSRNVSLGILARLARVLETNLSSVVGVADDLES